jgi:hypothetical protein
MEASAAWQKGQYFQFFATPFRLIATAFPGYAYHQSTKINTFYQYNENDRKNKHHNGQFLGEKKKRSAPTQYSVES